MSLETPDVEDKFVSPTATYDQGEVKYGNDPAETGASATGERTDVDSTKQIAKNRRAITVENYPSIAADFIALRPVNGRILMGWEVSETAEVAAAAEVIILHGQDASSRSKQIARVPLAVNTSFREWYGPDGLDIPNGIFVDFVSGTLVDVTLFYAHE